MTESAPPRPADIGTAVIGHVLALAAGRPPSYPVAVGDPS